MPVIAVQQYGLGQVMFIGTDNTWRWRKNAGDFYYTLIWGQISQRISIQRLLVFRSALNSHRPAELLHGDRGLFTRGLYSGVGFDPVQSSREGVLRTQERQRSATRSDAAARAGAAGDVSRRIHRAGRGRLNFWSRRSADATRLQRDGAESSSSANGDERAVALKTCLQHWRSILPREDLYKLPNTISAKTERVQSPLEVELWARHFTSCSCSAW